MWMDFIVLGLVLILLPFLICDLDKNGILFCIISFIIVFLIIACEIAAIIIKVNAGENTIFNIIMIPVQAINLTTISMRFYVCKEKNKKKNMKNVNLEDVIV